MKKFLLDTNILIDQLRGFRKINDTIKSLTINDDFVVSISVFTELEIYLGKSINSPKMKKEADKLLNNIVRISINSKIARFAGELKRKQQMATGDALIAATAIINKCVLITGNIKHFKNIPDLKVKKPK